MFNKILIANRGEIACRIIKTAKNMGIETVAVYSTADQHSLHTTLADEAIWIGESKAGLSYLNIDAIIDAAIASKSEAIHPGYGFLSENPDFARACDAAGIIFIGPSVQSMLAMASKQLAKKHLEKSNVPLTPGYHGTDQSDKTLLTEARKIGFPVLLKAANGGGGKGMRAVQEESDFSESLASARREALASFGDEIMIIEKLIADPRHIEVQIMADNHGHVVHLFERDCSLQRRHQKIIEEAPAPHLSDALRNKLYEAACEVARSIHYRGAGTVEFLVSQSNDFYFMEMNTRLQVEHPVTEMITGLDLVAWQLKIAANEPLPYPQKQITQHGHAIECRIYAEDPNQHFMPSIGQLHFLKSPQGEGIRVDTGVAIGASITQYYDPMIAKLIAYGNTREEALRRLHAALSHYAIGGVKTNIPFLRAIIQTDPFQKARITTDFLNQTPIDIDAPPIDKAMLAAAAFDYLRQVEALNDPLWQNAFAWQTHGTRHWFSKYTSGEINYSFRIDPISASTFVLHHQENKYTITVKREQEYILIRDQTSQQRLLMESYLNQIFCYFPEGVVVVDRAQLFQTEQTNTQPNQGLTAPMPATIVALLKHRGDSVKRGDRLVVLEAMKMEHTIHAPNDGILSEIFYEVGSQVSEGAALLALTSS